MIELYPPPVRPVRRLHPGPVPGVLLVAPAWPLPSPPAPELVDQIAAIALPRRQAGRGWCALFHRHAAMRASHKAMIAATMAACASLQPMDELTRFRWELIAAEVVDRVFAEAGVDEFLEAGRVRASMVEQDRAFFDQAPAG